MGLIVCIGAGPAGLTAAYELVSQGRDVLVLEADPVYVGGISRTVRYEGFCFDIGGHRFFSKSKEVVALWKEIMGNDLLLRPRKSRIYYGGKFYPYPLDLKQTLANLGLFESGLCGLSYLKALVFPCCNPQTFEQWVSNQFGTRLFRTFFKTYTEKVWGMKCSEISADWAAQRIKNLSLFAALKNAVFSAVGWKPKNTKIKTLIEEFLYPRKGPGMMWESAVEKITQRGGRIEMGCKATSLAYDATTGWTVTYQDGKTGKTMTIVAEHIISTMPMNALVAAVRGAPESVKLAAASLRYRDFLIVALMMKDKRAFDDNWLYIHEPNVKVGRIQNFKSWSPEMVPDQTMACYGMEYFCFEGDGLWNTSDTDLVTLATKELAAIGLASVSNITGGCVVRQPKAYPIYDQDYQKHVDVIRQWIQEKCPNLQLVGRNGMHKYNNQDHSMMTAMLAARNILAGRQEYNVWQVNQDAEYHEEDRSSGASGERHVPKAV